MDFWFSFLDALFKSGHNIEKVVFIGTDFFFEMRTSAISLKLILANVVIETSYISSNPPEIVDLRC